jgi:hypothetical protein
MYPFVGLMFFTPLARNLQGYLASENRSFQKNRKFRNFRIPLVSSQLNKLVYPAFGAI